MVSEASCTLAIFERRLPYASAGWSLVIAGVARVGLLVRCCVCETKVKLTVTKFFLRWLHVRRCPPSPMRSLSCRGYIFLCTDSFELCYGLNKLYTASTGYTENHEPSGHSSALAALGTLQPGPRVHDFPYIPRTQCITVIHLCALEFYMYKRQTHTCTQDCRFTNSTCRRFFHEQFYIQIYKYTSNKICPIIS